MPSELTGGFPSWVIEQFYALLFQWVQFLAHQLSTPGIEECRLETSLVCTLFLPFSNMVQCNMINALLWVCEWNAVSAGGVWKGLSNGQSHQLFSSPLKCSRQFNEP